jgi:cytochrome c oxidase cbb3-type subunit 3
MKNVRNKTTRRSVAALLIAGTLLAPSAAQANDTRDAVANSVALRAQAQQGARVFAERCSGCHGDDAHGDIGPNLTDAQWIYGGSPSAVRQSVTKGRPGGMPAWGGKLSAEQVDAVLAFLAMSRG